MATVTPVCPNCHAPARAKGTFRYRPPRTYSVCGQQHSMPERVEVHLYCGSKACARSITAALEGRSRRG